MKESVEHAVQAIRSHPEYHLVRFSVNQVGNSVGWFDSKRLERALYNLLLNACEAVATDRGCIDIDLKEVDGGVEIRVSDNGRGIPESIRGKLFEPFISYGKENGTGLGLTVVQKIVQDHGGDVSVEKTSEHGTVFRLLLPLASVQTGEDNRGEKLSSPPIAQTKRVLPE